MRRTASPSRPYGRDAVGLRPSLDPDAYFDAPSRDQEAPKQAKANPAGVLTGPAPSGMTWVPIRVCRWSLRPCSSLVGCPDRINDVNHHTRRADNTNTMPVITNPGSSRESCSVVVVMARVSPFPASAKTTQPCYYSVTCSPLVVHIFARPV